MSFRSNDEMSASFRRIVDVLDPKVRALLEATDLEVLDRCNRSGFDPSGFGQHRWEYRFFRTTPCGSYLARCTVEASYVEPLVDRKDSTLDLSWTAEVFALGSIPFYQRECHQEVGSLIPLGWRLG